MVWYFNTNSSNIVSYPVVWEPTKEPSNVVDYNIREEQTIDQSSIFTANNDTTTGMANQIPWINCPKLIASTSIIDDRKSSWSNIVEISDYTSIDERQPVVDRVLGWEFVCVVTIFPDYSLFTKFWLIPITTITNGSRIRFQWIWVGTQWVRVNIELTDWVITNINPAHWSI